MKLPQTLERINCKLNRRYAVGLSAHVRYIRPEFLRDNEHGPFLRLHVELDDGDAFTLDTFEVALLIQGAVAH